MKLATKQQISLYFFTLRVGIVGGALFGMAFGAVMLGQSLIGAGAGALSGAIDATTMMALIGGAEIFLPRTRLGLFLERAPFILTLAAKVVVYGAVIALIFGGRLGPNLVLALGIAGNHAQEVRAKFDSALPPALAVTLGILLTSFYVLMRQFGRLVGHRTLWDIIFGRYHHARTEERFFLFVDIVGSTPLAEKLGATTVHRFLDRVFRIASDPIDDHGGDIYQYVGDEIVITWLVPEGRPSARPLACYFAIVKALADGGNEFGRDFGAAPRMRAALHAGPVIAGEVGGSRRGIVFHGDVMNTASRLENATRDLKRSFLISADALARLEGKEVYTFIDLGPQQLRGREAALHVYAVESAQTA